MDGGLPCVSASLVGYAEPPSGTCASGQELAREPLGLVDVGEGHAPGLSQTTDTAPAVIDGDRAEEIALHEDGVAARDIALRIGGMEADGMPYGNDADVRHADTFPGWCDPVQRVF